jgi:hypothetical protein
VGNGSSARDCRRIGQLRTMFSVDIIDYSQSGECRGGRDIGVKDRGGREGKVEKGRENGRKGQKK